MILGQLAERFPWLKTKTAISIPDDLEVRGTQLLYNDQGELDAMLLEVCEREGGRHYAGYRAVRLLELRFISLEARRDAGLLQKMRTVLRGLWGAQVDLVYLAAGMFRDPGLGIVQCYGVSVFSASQEEALERSGASLAALKALLVAAYRQLRLEPLSSHAAGWLAEALAEMPYALVTVGHPDPRENARGGDASQRDPLSSSSQGMQQYTQQQNELLFRGMASLKEEFLMILLASHVNLQDITLMLEGLLADTSVYASRQLGTRAASFGISLPAFLSGGLAENASQSYGTNHAEGSTQGEAVTDGTAQTDGVAHTVGQASTAGWAHTLGVSETDTVGSASTLGSAFTQGSAHTKGSSESSGTVHTQSSGLAASHSDSHSYGVYGGVGASAAPAGIGVSANMGGSTNWGTTDGSTASSGVADAVSQSTTRSQSDSVSQSLTKSQSETLSRSHATTRSEAWTESASHTRSVADTTSHADTRSHAETASTARSTSDAVGTGQVLGRSASRGVNVGVAPSFSISNANQWQDDPFILLTDIMRTQRRLLDVASREGAYYTDLYSLTRTSTGAQVLMGLIPEAFHGTEDVVAGVQTRSLSAPEQAYIGLHARAFTPSTRVETIPQAMSGYTDSTLLTMLQVAAYTAPGTFEQGAALTTQEETPAFAFYPDMPGDLRLARQYSCETGLLTEAFLKISRERHFHTAFVGDTGFGKSVAAERLAYETTRFWHYRTVVLDFGQGWRKALNWPGVGSPDADGFIHLDIRQLTPGGPRPLRWNILQVPERVDPARYRSMVAELFANAGRMGARQLGFMRRTLTELYTESGVLTSDPRLQQGRLGQLQNEAEAAFVQRVRGQNGNALEPVRPGSLLSSLSAAELQQLAVYRSRKVDASAWVERLWTYKEKLMRDQASRTSLEGVLLRLEQFSEGGMARQYGADPAGAGVDGLGLVGCAQDPWGITVIEGGADMDEYSKAALLALLASIFYADAVARRRETLAGRHFPPMQIFFEEANKVLTGVSGGAASDHGAADSSDAVSQLFQTMWRDGRKYGVFLHLLAQTVSEIPAGILSSCANIFVFQTKNPRDRDLILPHLGKSEKGLVNTEYKRYLARIPRSYAICKLGYSDDVLQLEPVLTSPLMLHCSEPADEEIRQALGEVDPQRRDPSS